MLFVYTHAHMHARKPDKQVDAYTHICTHARAHSGANSVYMRGRVTLQVCGFHCEALCRECRRRLNALFVLLRACWNFGDPSALKAMAFTALFSAIFLDFSMGFHNAAGYLVSFFSMCLYYAPNEVLLSTDVEFIKQVTAASEAKTDKAK